MPEAVIGQPQKADLHLVARGAGAAFVCSDGLETGSRGRRPTAAAAWGAVCTLAALATILAFAAA